MENIVVKKGLANITEFERQQWITLFKSCFSKTDEQAVSVFKKYEIHYDSCWFCMAFVEDKLVACYSGIVLPINNFDIFLSTDTMSNGVIRNATVKLARPLYEDLKGSGVRAVCGFPNKNILSIREKRLGWTIVGEIYYYVGIPFLWRLFRIADAAHKKYQWFLNRPLVGCFARPVRFLSILGRYKVYGSRISFLVLACGSKKPGIFFIRIPSFLIQPKKFGYVMLGNVCIEDKAIIEQSVDFLDMNSIDVP